MWDTIATDLERAITERRLAPGDKLPSEQQLVRKYYVNRHMVRRALSRLVQKGLIISHQGRGSYVSRSTFQMPITQRTRFSQSVRAAGAVHSNQTLRLEVIPGPADVARELEVKAGTAMLRLERLSVVDGQATGISDHYFVAVRVPGFAEVYEQCGSITATLITIGIHDYVRLRTRIHARLPTPGEAQLLGMPQHVPLIITRATNVDLDGAILEYGEARLAADRVELVMQSPPTPEPNGASGS
ncbi:phosphonate metabolism transcriptional regulator PhnF [Sandarakinorhabdus limnophila]|uniref:phosphonate metabolism transcriptional regulator PhnF n=1 Tax=Sandarakinorhabdus limnophila TaxID=210512 RepID=UPI0026EED65A|nr:phosphonate metabolism transcriptional regulator PhnF [Sandarakinorhabdus limnophila]